AYMDAESAIPPREGDLIAYMDAESANPPNEVDIIAYMDAESANPPNEVDQIACIRYIAGISFAAVTRRLPLTPAPSG
ncbi:hypothetical protein, partial [Cohnella lubricantis]